jgi:hypothetical protein
MIVGAAGMGDGVEVALQAPGQLIIAHGQQQAVLFERLVLDAFRFHRDMDHHLPPPSVSCLGNLPDMGQPRDDGKCQRNAYPQ